jgi:hypothetical protein
MKANPNNIKLFAAIINNKLKKSIKSGKEEIDIKFLIKTINLLTI